MEVPRNAGGLHLVSSKAERTSAIASLVHHMPAQIAMFPAASRRLIVFVTFSRVSDSEFLQALDIVRPHLVVDVRRFPRFDNGKLNRQLAFESFDQAHARYIDLLWTVDETCEGKSNPLLSFDVEWSVGPVMFLVEAKQTCSQMFSTITAQVTAKSKTTWDVLEVPAAHS